jgi:predicted DNA-binding transcriptional regulator AlpA
MSGERRELTAAQRRAISDFDRLPADAGLDVVVVAALLTTSVATVWRRTAVGNLPAPVRARGMTRWPVGEVRKVLRGEWAGGPGMPSEGV